MTKTIKTTIILSSLMFGLLIGVNNTNAASLATTLKGKILLQVEQNGEAWYVNPSNELRYYLGRPDDAFNVMRELGLGITNKDFDSFNGYAPSRLSGRILLKVEDSGKAYYVNTNDLKMYYLGRPADAFNVMRELGLGITDKNLSLINIADNETASWQTYKNEQYGFEVRYPKDWKIVNVDWTAGRKYVQFYSPLINNKYNFGLDIGVRNKGDNIQISLQPDEDWELLKSFMRLGDKVKIGNVEVLTTEFVENGKVKSILYSNRLGAGRVEISGLEIQAVSSTIEGPQHLSASDVEGIDLKNFPELKLANLILSTFKLTN